MVRSIDSAPSAIKNLVANPAEAGGPGSDGGPPTMQEEEPSLEVETSTVPAEAIFGSFALEPYETVFASPSREAIFTVVYTDSEISEGSDNNREENGVASSKQDPQCYIRNLDTNEYRCLGGAVDLDCSLSVTHTALTNSFLHDQTNNVEKPTSFKGANKPAKSAWVDWWAEKRIKDEHLWRAAESGSIELVREALAAPEDAGAPRATVNSKSLYGRTALHMAASIAKPDCIEVLLNAGSDLEACTDAGLTALHVACQRGNLEVVVLLLDWSAEISPLTNDRNLPLHLAALHGHADVVTALLARGGSEQLSIRNSMGRRAAEVCLDIRTAEAFKDYDNCESGEDSPAADKYAGRTAFHNGEVLLHNARADAVFRLLNKAQSQNVATLATEIQRDSSKKSARQHRHAGGRVRAPFARIRQDNAIEQVGPDSFALMERVGKGSFGEVYMVKHKETADVYAMKILRKSKVMAGNLLRYTLTERNVLTYITHPYIVSLHYAFQTPTYLVLLLQFCPGGNLQKLIEKEKRLQDPSARMFTAEVLLALIYLHERKIVYRDLKPDNVVIDEIGHGMLTDFGLSKEGVSALHGTKSFCGSMAFIAPEILRDAGHRHTVDIYGLGVLLFDMLTGMPPFYNPNREKLCYNIKHARLSIPLWVTSPASSLIRALLEREPTARLGANDSNDVKKHEYFEEMDFDALMKREVPPPVSFNISNRFHQASKSVDRCENPFKNAAPGRSQQVSNWSFAGGN